MAVPKQRQTRSRTRRRRGGHDKVQMKKLITCTNCQKEILPHRACSHCGYYKGEEIVGVIKK
jgi:large subunit ribosomal protein L32